MRKTFCCWTVWIAAAALVAVMPLCADEKGVRARPSPADYPARSNAPALQLAAELLSADQVRNTFATDLNRGFLVIEVGVFPANGWDLRLSDFSLRIGSDKFVRPVAASTIASILQSKNLGRHKQGGAGRSGGAGPADLVVYPSATIGYESGGAVYDPVTGRRRTGGGWVTGAGVGVGMGGPGQQPSNGGGNPLPPPGASDADRRVMATELEDKALPEGEARGPVAGYLYFPLPEARKGGPDPKKAYELTYQTGDVKLRLNVPAPK